MLFNKKNKKQEKCENCGSRSDKKFSFCPHCGNSLIDLEKEQKNFGLLGKNDFSGQEINSYASQSFGITDKLINSMFNSIMKNLDKQFKNQFNEMEKDLERTEIKRFPNGIRIKISSPYQQKSKAKPKQNLAKRTIDEEQLKKMSSLPRAKAKTNVKRVGNTVIYELSTPGVSSPQDIFISKLESGYEIKVIGSKKIYVNSVPINLPLKRYSVLKNKLLVEFLSGEE